MKHIQNALQKLQNSGIENPLREIGYIIRHLFAKEIYSEKTLQTLNLSDTQWHQFNSIIERRSTHEPLAKIFGFKEFWKDQFITNKFTLDPRPDTETMIEAVLEQCKDQSKSYRILDLGTGTGCIILSLLKEYPNSQGVGVDISHEALDVSKHNAKALGLEERYKALQSNWFSNVSGKFDIIVSNPPYIPLNDPRVDQSTKNFDPPLSLYSGSKGLDAIISILNTMREHLTDHGLFFLEIGEGQLTEIAELQKKLEKKVVIKKIYKDLSGIPRVLVLGVGILEF